MNKHQKLFWEFRSIVEYLLFQFVEAVFLMHFWLATDTEELESLYNVCYMRNLYNKANYLKVTQETI
jgi:hypothetical protein